MELPRFFDATPFWPTPFALSFILVHTLEATELLHELHEACSREGGSITLEGDRLVSDAREAAKTVAIRFVAMHCRGGGETKKVNVEGLNGCSRGGWP